MKGRAVAAPRRAAALAAATSAFLFMGALPALAAPDNAHGNGPPGANGDIKVHQDANDTAHHNVPHVDCSFYVAFFGFDADQAGTLSFTLQAPTLRDGDDQSLESDAITLGNDARGTGATFDPVGSGVPTDTAGQAGPFQLDFTGVTPQPQQGFHVKVRFAITHEAGKSGNTITTYKSKVIWVAPCTGGPGPGTPTVAALRVCKTTTGSLAGTFPFTITGPNDYSTSFQLVIPTGSHGPVCHADFTNLVIGDYTVTEPAVPAVFTLKSIKIVGGTGTVSGNSATVTLTSDANPTVVVTTFTNGPAAAGGSIGHQGGSSGGTIGGVGGGTPKTPTTVLGEHFNRPPATPTRVLGVQVVRPKALPFTGSHTKPLLGAGLIALVCGTLLVLAGRRPTPVYAGRHRLT